MDEIAMLRITSERNLEIGEKLCACFTDWQKAPNSVNWTKLIHADHEGNWYQVI